MIVPELVQNTSLVPIPIDHEVLTLLQRPSQPLLTKLKLRVRKQRRQLAKKYHPDLNPKNLKRMQQVNQLCDFLLASKIMYRPPPVQFHYTVHVYQSQPSYYTTGYDSTATGGFS